MGLIKAGIGALGGTLADQWKEFFYCDSLSMDVLVAKGQKRTTSRTSNTKGNDNIISNGSVIAVNEGQCMLITEQGKVVEFCAEAGEFTYDTSTEPSLFTGKLSKSIIDTFKTIGRRFTFGGDTGKDQRVYYFNTKEIMNNKFGTPNPIEFRVVDSKVNFDMDVSLRINGIYSYRMVDPLLFYTNVCANVTDEFRREEIDSQLKTEFIDKFGPAVARLSELEIRPNQITAHQNEIKDYVNEALTDEWGTRGLRVEKIALSPPTLTEADKKKLQDAQESAVYANPLMGAGARTMAAKDAMRDAAKNSAGAMTGFMGFGMAGNAGAAETAAMYNMGMQQQAAQQAQQAQQPQAAAPAAAGWKCSCGATANGNFCPNCGAKKPAAPESWTCSCGAVNQGNFCPNCGAKKPAARSEYRCSKCGWEPEDPSNPPKFCPQCGDPFGEEDKK
ncbi:MAG: SPFH domain-containing protein [Clostridia bacterium]|nr:SPFH domain-containing protein [Clostridia bacterium]